MRDLKDAGAFVRVRHTRPPFTIAPVEKFNLVALTATHYPKQVMGLIPPKLYVLPLGKRMICVKSRKYGHRG